MTSAPLSGDGNDIFYPPSASWLSRAGVVVSYSPEDTMKSIIMQQKTRKQQALMQVNRDITSNILLSSQTHVNSSTDLKSTTNTFHGDVIDETDDRNSVEEYCDVSDDEAISSVYPSTHHSFPYYPRSKQITFAPDAGSPQMSPRGGVDLDETDEVVVDTSSSHSSRSSVGDVENRLPLTTPYETEVDGIPCPGKSFDQLLADALQQTMDPSAAVPNSSSLQVVKNPALTNNKPPKKTIKTVDKPNLSSDVKCKEASSDVSTRTQLQSKLPVEDKLNVATDRKSFKRPFLRKNQGRAAWAHKVHSPPSEDKSKPDLNMERSVEKVELIKSKVSNNSALLSSMKKETTAPLTVGSSVSDDIILVPASRRTESKQLPPSTRLQKADPETDLEEFELLEKAAERSLNGSISSLARMDKSQIKTRLDQRLPTVNETTTSSKTKSVDSSPKGVWFQDEDKWSSQEDLKDMLESHRGKASSSQLDNLAAEIFPKMPAIDKRPSNPLENTSVQASQLRHWVKVLEDEIKRFNNENAALAKLKQEKEEGLKRLQKEVKEFEEFKAKELRQIEEFRDTEMKKLKKERKLFDEYQKAMKVAPDRKEREEIERLRTELREVREEMSQKETRWHNSQASLRRHLEQVEAERDELLSQVKTLEQKRLELQSRVTLLSSGKSAESPAAPQRAVANDVKAPTLTRTTQAVHFKKAPLVGAVPPSTGAPPHHNHVTGKPNLYLAGILRDSTGSGYCTGDDDTTTTTGASSTNGETQLNNSAAVCINRDAPRVVQREAAQTRVFPSRDSAVIQDNVPAQLEIPHQDGTIERRMADGSRQITFPNGSIKKISADGKLVVVELFNGDIKKNLPDGQEIYYFAQQKVTQTKFPDGTEEFVYADGRKEILRPTGQREYYPTVAEQGVRVVWPNGDEQMMHPNGLIVWTRVNGQREIHFPNGQKEIHLSDSKRRIYPDGTVKIVYEDGSQETRYASGRIRKKDCHGNLILDTKPTPS